MDYGTPREGTQLGEESFARGITRLDIRFSVPGIPRPQGSR